MINLYAPAKINLTLEVLGKREDGYHEISSILQTISLEDEISIEPGVGIEIKYDPPLSLRHDLVFKAANLIRGEKRLGALIRVRKKIPISSGLGGGSSDAASAIKGLNMLWGLGLDAKELLSLSSKVSCDCPFFIVGGTALAQGKGEIITPLPTPSDHLFILLFPPIPVPENKTEIAYKMLKEKSFTNGEYSQRLVEHLRLNLDLNPELLFNVFEGVAFDLFPGLDRFRELFLKAGASSVHLSGSGPTLFCPEKDPDKAHFILKRLKDMGLRAVLVRAKG